MFAPVTLRLLSGLALTTLASTGPAAQTSVPRATGTVVFGGDVVPHAALLRSFETYGSASLLGPIAPVLRSADVALVNLETPVSRSRPITRVGFHFNVHDDFLQALIDAGIDGVSVANNHSYDMGIGGVGETVRAVRTAGITPIGGALVGEDEFAPQRFTLADGTLCVFAATRLLNDALVPGLTQPRVAWVRPRATDSLLAAIRRERPNCGAVIVSLHTGVEYGDQPLGVDRTYFRRVADAGADAVIGHHSHTPHPVELYTTGTRQVPLFYSLGNLVSNQGYHVDSGRTLRGWNIGYDPRTREALLAVMRFEGDGSGRLQLREFGFAPLWTINTRESVRSGEVPQISASLMPRDGGGDSLLTQRWNGLVSRVGSDHLVPVASLPGNDRGYALSTEAALNARRAITQRVAATPSRAPSGGRLPARRSR